MTLVQFYVVKKNYIHKGEIIAFFPKEKYDNYNPNLFTSYQHIGQHSGCHVDYIKDYCRKAKPTEYADLLQELKSIGYDDLVIK